jgi:YbgC/YbaW family acyl-CoA thioester hydrolase
MVQPFRHQSRIRFVDTDASGRIHYTALFKFFEAAETELFRLFDISYTGGTFNFPRVHAECDIRLPLLHDDLIEIEVCLTKLGTSSMRFDFTALKDGESAATVAVVMVCMDRRSQRAIEIPEELRMRFAEILMPPTSAQTE